MKQFHGINQEFATPDLRKSRNRRDFGRGFYLTTLESQARGWALTMRDRFGGLAIVNTYSFVRAESLLLKEFEGLTMDWLEMVKTNRLNGGTSHDFDVVIGPVANCLLRIPRSALRQGVTNSRLS
ncbi:MAG: DUF3990 domain-containing protein [Propionibacteriaceae bacterium]|jgi:hypothetical protein|nr:DUF3990 domain-containing protein [Propionibacteriaceae bacterium]